MAKYRIKIVGKGLDVSSPYVLSKGTNSDLVQTINGNNCYTQLYQDTLSGSTNIVSIENCKFVGTDFNNVFKGCTSLVKFKNNTFSNDITSFLGTFDGCNSLTSIDLSNGNFAQATNTSSMFQQCANLVSVTNNFGNYIPIGSKTKNDSLLTELQIGEA